MHVFNKESDNKLSPNLVGDLGPFSKDVIE